VTGTRLSAVQALLNTTPGVVSAKTLSDGQLNALLRPWLGADVKDLAAPVPAVIAVRMAGDAENSTSLAMSLAQNAPGTIVEDHAAWAAQLGTLARSLQFCSGFVLLIVTVVTAAVIAVVMRSGLPARRQAILVVYQLGATDSYIVRRFAVRAAVLASIGGAMGGLLALPVLFAMATITAPLAGEHVLVLTVADAISVLPVQLWVMPVVLMVAVGIVAYVSTQFTIRQWLRQLP
jgi:cell division transport system permease protein